MAVAKLVRDVQLPTASKEFAASTVNFCTLVYRTAGGVQYFYGPAVRIVNTDTAIANWSVLKDCCDQNSPIAAVPVGFVHDTAGVTEITSDKKFVAYFNPTKDP